MNTGVSPLVIQKQKHNTATKGQQETYYSVMTSFSKHIESVGEVLFYKIKYAPC
jgi:hypothetical protein